MLYVQMLSFRMAFGNINIYAYLAVWQEWERIASEYWSVFNHPTLAVWFHPVIVEFAPANDETQTKGCCCCCYLSRGGYF